MGICKSSAFIHTEDDIERFFNDWNGKIDFIHDFTFEQIDEIEEEIIKKTGAAKSSQKSKEVVYEFLPQSKADFQGPKKLVVFCDGSGNTNQDTYNTNIAILYNVISTNLDKLEENCTVKYFPGVATQKSGVTSTADFVFAFSIDAYVTNVLDYIFKNYEEGDELIIFGFSRGSFAARVIGNVLRFSGIPKHNKNADEAYDKYQKACRDFDDKKKMVPQSNTDKFIIPRISFIGLYDTVPGLTHNQLKEYDYFFHVEDENPIIESACHIMAEDMIIALTDRSYFSSKDGGAHQSLENGPTDLSSLSYQKHQYLEFRYIGGHCNIGGSWMEHPEKEKGLSNNTLRYLLAASPLGKNFFPLFEETSTTFYPTVSKEELSKYVKNNLNEKDMKGHEVQRRIYLLIEDSNTKIPKTTVKVHFACQSQQN